jgi:peptide/nickel transport system ATP-binding protein/oligopeptide transport system ATP-binding protein
MLWIPIQEINFLEGTMNTNIDSEIVIEVKNLRTYFETEKGLNPAVDCVSWHIKKGRTMGLVGESGSGKSISALSILGLVPEPYGRIMEGSEILFNGMDLTKLSESQLAGIRGNEIAMIFQEPMTSLNPVYTIGKQLIEPLMIHRKIKKSEAKKIALDLLDSVKVPDAKKRFNVYPHQLSGGLRQRVMIAMALTCEPKLLIADEPTTALDVTIQAQILRLMRELQKKSDTAILYITHNLGVVAEMCDDVCVMYAGEIVEQCDIYELFKNPCHPYTKGLLKSLPKIHEDVDELYSIKGMVPNMLKMPKGCRFASRCEDAKKICFEKIPPVSMSSNDHLVKCWNFHEGGDIDE